MTTRGWIAILIVCFFVSGFFGYLVKASSEPLGKAMAWGYEEKSNVWNRIRVDEQGFVMCHVYNEEKK